MQIAGPIAARRPVLLRKMAGREILLSILAVALGVAGSAFVYANPFTPAVAVPASPTVPVQRGNVAATISATGSVVATKQVKLVFGDSGRISDILVSVGDSVTAGQPLAHLVADSYQVKLETAKSQLNQAQIKLQQLTEGLTAEDIAAAQAAYDAAVATYNHLITGPTRAD